jgi:tetratricopeptide (TPR) repeat protein
MLDRLVRQALAALAVLLLVPSYAAAKDWQVVRKNGQKIEATKVTVDASGTLTVVPEGGGNVTMTLKWGDYISVRSPEAPPLAEVRKLFEARQYAKVPAAAEKLFPMYRYLGWADELSQYWALSLLAQKDADGAAKVLDDGLRFTLVPEDRAKLFKAQIEVLMAQGKFDQAQKVLGELSAKDPEAMAYQWNITGRLLGAQEGKEREAILQHLKVVLMFPEAGEVRRSSYAQAIALLKKLGDKRAAELEKQMQAEYK